MKDSVDPVVLVLEIVVATNMDPIWKDCTDLVRQTPQEKRSVLYRTIVDGSEFTSEQLQSWLRSPSMGPRGLRVICAQFISSLIQASADPDPTVNVTRVPPLPKISQQEIDSEVPDRNRIKLMSWNVRNLSANTAAARLLRIASGTVSQSIVALQEVCGSEPDTVLKRLTPAEASFKRACSSRLGDPRRRTEHLAVLYNPEHVKLLSGVTITRNLTYGIFVCIFQTTRGQRFTLINVHISFGKSVDERRAETAQVLRHVRAILALPETNKAGPLLIAGDFNLDPDDAVFDDIRINSGYVSLNALAQPTTVGGSPYDNFWVPLSLPGLRQRSWQVVTFDECHDDDAKRDFIKNFSDHYAIRIVLHV